MKRLVACLLLCWCCTAPAQDAQPLQLLGAAEAQALRRVLAQPVPQGVTPAQLRQHFIEKDQAAGRLSDLEASKAVAAQAMQALPQDARWPNQLAAALQAEGRAKEALPLYEAARERAPNAANRQFYESNAIELLVQLAELAPDVQARWAAARDATQALLDTPALEGGQRLLALRAMSALFAARCQLDQRRGRGADAVLAAAEGERLAREALKLAEAHRPQDLRFAAGDFAARQRRHAAALRLLERDAEAEAVLQEHLQTIQRHAVGAATAAAAHHALAALRIAQRHWPEAEAQLRLSMRVLEQLGRTGAHPNRLERIEDLVPVLWAQGQAAEAQALLDELDRAAAGDQEAQARIRLPAARGLAHLGGGRFTAAAPRFAEAARERARRWGAGHYFVSQMEGLHGLALWRSGDATQRTRGAELLRKAVQDLRAPRNADFNVDRGIRGLLRELILAAYIDAETSRGGLGALWAMGAADTLRGGVTAQALADAALRASTTDPDLAALARQEQDARREWLAAEQQLGSAAADTAQAERLRGRLQELEQLRQRLQQRLRERFPGYEQVQRPTWPDPAAVAERLGRDEQLLMLMPTERALLAWVVSAGELPHFQRIDIDAATLRELVQRHLSGVVLLPGASPPRFDAEAAHALFQRVLAPLAPRLNAAAVVVAASGPLAPVPWATLLTAPPERGTAPAWLVHRHAIVQVPSVTAWLGLRQAARGTAAPEALMAWGDPLFAGPSSRPAATRAPAGLRYADIPPLPETRDELVAVARALKADPARDLHLGAQATRESVLKASSAGLLARKRVVFFATHGLVAGELPGLRSPALAMALPASGEAFAGGLLTLEDVLGLKLNADWVVLSACNTAAGDGRAEEMLSGLARGFFYAGSRSVLVTQWAVETESAKRLTTAVFEHQARHATASKAESLRQAMLQVMAQPGYAHPSFWAPYILVGDGAR